MAIKEGVIQEGIAAIVPSPAIPVLSSQPGPSYADNIQLEAQPPPAKRKNLGKLFKELEEEHQLVAIVNSVSLSPEQKCKKKIVVRYLKIQKPDFEDDPLLWWKNNCSKFPILSALARKYLCVCATSAPSERVFSCSENIVTPHRASMNPDKVDVLTFLSKNMN